MTTENRTYLSLGIGVSALLLTISSIFYGSMHGKRSNLATGGSGDTMYDKGQFLTATNVQPPDYIFPSTNPSAILTYPSVPSHPEYAKLQCSVSVAIQNISTYSTRPAWIFSATPTGGGNNSNTIASSFIIPGNVILSYITDAISYGNCAYVHLFLGEDNTNKQCLYVAATQKGTQSAPANHCYIIPDLTQLTNKYVLQCSVNTIVVNTNNAGALTSNIPILLPLGAPSIRNVSGFNLEEKLLYNGNYPNTMNSNYILSVITPNGNPISQDNQPDIKNAISFKINAANLLYYIRAIMYSSQSANIEFILGLDDGRLTLMVDGLSRDGQTHILVGDGNSDAQGNPNGYLFEHCCPCPTCEDLVNNGSSLEQ